jgi:Fe-S-cluster-containing dehydrogenase component
VKLCPFGALSANGRGPVALDITKCWGCGICRTGCTTGALSLTDRRSVPEVATLW